MIFFSSFTDGVSTNHLVTLYERKLGRALDKVLKLQGHVESLKSSSDELAAKAEQAWLRDRELEEEVVAVQSEKSSLET
ncbi:unnamed protein product [Arabis nemorensis]|uniref:Uncharacterized protein n=1 Tax=Arabis nemorensis TaxID=586526 RepID=A0A565B5S3_9BRAS|nr:unnamed protein product [Arabis nemorensis]